MRLPFSGSYPLTQAFGENYEYYHSNFGMNGHNGQDYGLPIGTPVLAAESGRVSLLNDPPGFGVYIQIRGAHTTLYAHLKSYAVSNGQVVDEGQLIAYSGNTGNSSGPHLHFGVKPLNPNNTNGYFGAIDPAPLLIGGTMAETYTSPVNGDTRDAHGWYDAYAERNEQWRHDQEVTIPELNKRIKELGNQPGGVTAATTDQLLKEVARRIL